MRCNLLRTMKIHCSWYMIGSALVIFTVLGLFHYSNSQAYIVSVGGHEVGIVEDALDVEVFVERFTEEYSELSGMELEFNKELTFAREFRPDCNPDLEAVQRSIKQIASFLTKAYMIEVDGKPFVPVACENDLEIMLESLEERYAGVNERDTAQVLEFNVEEDFELKAIKVDPRYVYAAAEAVSLLKVNGSDNPLMADARLSKAFQNSSHPPTIIAHEYNSGPALEEAAEAVRLSNKMNAVAADITVRVRTLEEITVTEEIPHSTEYIYDDDLPKSEQEVKEPGRDGKKEIVYLVEKENGQEIERETVSEEVIKEPEPRVKILGRKEMPSPGTGQFGWPVQGEGVIYNGFSSSHTGIDIHISHGTNVLAAADGVVTHDRYGGTQGKYLIIQHGEYWTLYLHNSEHLVSKGDRVKRGQPIARVGTTGRAFGPHLHFEVREDDGSREWNSYYQHKPVDPLQFFNRH